MTHASRNKLAPDGARTHHTRMRVARGGRYRGAAGRAAPLLGVPGVRQARLREGGGHGAAPADAYNDGNGILFTTSNEALMNF